MIQRPDDFVLGIDGGGSKTICWLAAASGMGEVDPVGRGSAGPANPQSVGWDAARRELSAAVDAAFAAAGLPIAPVAAACVALAGGDRESVRGPLERWAAGRGLASAFLATHDALPVLAAGTPEGHGIALISGTGSFAFGRAPDGATARAGGWGYLFGDEGSGYALALAGLRAVAKSADGRGPQTRLTERLLAEFGAEQPLKLIESVYPRAAERRWIAGLARPVLETAEQGDAVARQIVDTAAFELAAMVAAVARSLEFDRCPFALALGGGVLVSCEMLRRAVQEQLAIHGIVPASSEVVRQPVAGAVRLARGLLASPT